MKRLFTAFGAFMLAAAAFAVPAKRQIVTLTKADGTTVTAYLMGDEHFHYYQDAETGAKLLLDADEHCYVVTEREFSDRMAFANRRAERAQTSRNRARYNARPSADRTPFDLHGERRALLILVDFSDKPMKYTREDFDSQVNEVGYNGNGCYGSVHDYFYAQSYEQFDLTFDVVGPVRVSQKASYYGKNDTYGNDIYPATMVAEACELAYERGIDFADYDWNDDGEAEMVVCIYSGFGEAQGAPATTIWPHQWTLTDAQEYGDGPGRYEIGGTFVDRYLVLNELSGTSGSRLDGIGTFCHEYSHGLGLPDLYNTVGGSTFGMDKWSLMDSGNYNGDSRVPCAYTAYERMFCGWLDPTELKNGCEITGMKALTDEPEAYIIYNEAHPDEYYLLQNVQQVSWNEELPGHGLLVMHVDYDATVWENNTVNNDKNRRRCTIIPADNNTYTSTAGLAGDPYPGTKKNTELTDNSLPAAQLYNRNADSRKFLGKPIENITESFEDDKYNGTISFLFNGGEIVGIDNIAAEQASDAIFDLYGRRLGSAPAHGMYIKDGSVRTR